MNTQASGIQPQSIPRRQFLKESIILGSSAFLLLPHRRTFAGSPPPSPPTRPFVEELPIPPSPVPVPLLDPLPNGANHQLWDQYIPQEYFEIHEREALHSFHPDLPKNPIWGFNGIFPGPTFRTRDGKPILVRIHNDLPVNHVGFGIPETITHLHNAHSATESDGYPGDFYSSGKFKDFHYTNFCAGNDSNEMLGTLWYHDHRMDFTAQNVYKGLAGFHIRYDEVDSGDETDPNPNALRLPSGHFDIPLLFADKVFDSSGQIAFDPFNFDGILGDKYTVNGKIQPFFKVARRKYRFRFLDGGPSRFYEFFLSSKQPFVLIANDGNLLPAPLRMHSIRMGVAERMDVIIDFSQYKIGDQIYLLNRLEQQDGRGPTGKLLNPGTPILRFDVDRDEYDPSRIPVLLREQPTIDRNEVVKERTWAFERKNGAWVINGKLFDPDEPRVQVKQGTAEIWTLQNRSGSWSHPIHIHLEESRILSRNGKAPPAHEKGRKDVMVVGPNEEVRIFIRFRDLLGRYVMHCHNTVHEDHAMMLRWDVVR